MVFLRGRRGPVDYIVAGLGNPGPQYAKTKHNCGYFVLDLLADRHHTRVDRVKFRSLSGLARIDGKKVLLLKPQTFMNRSGEAVGEALRYYRVEPERLIVIFDDVELPPGKIRVRPGGASGGHNGMRSIISHLGTDAFPRVKIGIGRPVHKDDMADWVTSRFSSGERKQMDEVFRHAADAVELVLRDSPEAAAVRYNGMEIR